jgi:hypothetical protein
MLARVGRARRQHRTAVVPGELLVGPTGFGVVAAGRLDQRARLVGHDELGHPADELQRQHLCADPVLGGLARRGAGKGVVRRPEHGHEDLGPGDLAGGGVDHRHGVAGVVDEQLLAGDMHLAHGAQLGLGELAVLHAEAGVLVGQRVGAGVLLPKQHQRDARALELLVDDAEVRGQLVAGPGQRRPVQPGLQGLVAQAIGHREVHAGHLGQRNVLPNRALGNLEDAANLVVAQPGLQVQAQSLSDTAHGDSVRWHRLEPQKAASLCRAENHLRATPIVHDDVETASTIRLKRRPRSR